jgi:peptide subunit release factor 1 (eRF1)
MFMAKRSHLSRSQALRFLDELARAEGKAISVYIPRGTPRSRVENLLEKASAAAPVPPDMVEVIVGSEMGATLFRTPPKTYLVLPPFPLTEEYITDGCDFGPLHSLLSRDLLIGLVLVRLGSYSVGVCRGSELVDSKTGTGLIHARHHKGGSSQARFARHREKQIEQFLIRVCSHAREHIEPHARSLDYLVYGGARTTILLLRKQCPFLGQFDDRILRMLLDIPDPRKPVLEKAVSAVWATDVIEFSSDES